jgi:signal transduction histidine kinase
MSWSIRARLTTWYTALVLVVLASATVAIASVEAQMGLTRLDDELRRLALTVQAVMHNEFGEGLDLAGAAGEASTEVVTPGRSVVLVSTAGHLIRAWGQALPQRWHPSPHDIEADGTATSILLDGAGFRVVSRPVNDGGHAYVLAVAAPMAALDQERAELVEALAIGIAVALIVAAIGGWVIGRPALQPLSDMAREATLITERNLSARLTVPNRRDELGRVGTAFNALLDRLASSLTGERQFMADASHQLRTPVSVLRTTAQVTLRQPHRSEGEYREALAIVGEQSLRLTRLVDAMFLLARGEAGGRVVRREPVYLDEVVGECARALTMIAAERDVLVETVGDPDLSFVGDEELLRHLFTNLLDNAVRHTRPAGRVAAEVRRHAGEVLVRISDEGSGIADGDRERIFERFTRLDERGPGAGLGLPIARWIAEAHGGQVELESTGSRGSVFTVRLPIVREPALDTV